jgi:hypothetical protein
MRKYADGFYFQKCQKCGKIIETTDKGEPILAPLAGHSDCGWDLSKNEKDD